MTTQFSSFDEAKNVFLSMCKFPLKDEDLVEDPDLKVLGMEGWLLQSKDTPQETKDRIQAKIDAQKGFVIDTPDGKFGIVIGPFREGFECWIVHMESGMANRI